ncbi:IS66 family transposase [Myxococcota bacterium]
MSRRSKKLDRIIAEISSKIEELQQENAQLRQENAQLRQENAQLRARVEDLEEQLRTDSSNSSKPPSSDPPGTKRRRKGKRKRKPGGQPGHAGKTRELLPPEQVDEIVPCPPPDRCGCGGDVVPDGQEPRRHQQLELPEQLVWCTEFQQGSGICDKCGKVHYGELPEGTPPGMLGPRAMASVGLMSGKYHLSKRQIEEIWRDLFGARISLGTVSNIEARVSAALVAPVDEARSYVKQQAVVHADETSHKVAGKKAWLWAAVTSLVSVFLIRPSRATAEAVKLLGKGFAGILVSDRWSGYTWIDPAWRQLCWAHLIRDLTKIAARGGRSEEIANAILEHVKEMFVLWRMLQDGKRKRPWFRRRMVGIRADIELLLAQGEKCGHAKTQRTCKRILKLKAALWTFVEHEGVEPTNNLAERTIRPYVLWRKVSFGTQSDRGNRFVERMLTVSATCRLQQRNVLDYLTDAISAFYLGQPIPSLLPTEEMVQALAAA